MKRKTERRCIFENQLPRRFMARCAAVTLCIFSISWLDPYRDRVSEGNREFKAKNYSAAEERYRAASTYAPNEVERNKLHFNLGDARYMRGEYEKAVDDFKKSLDSEDREVQKKALFNAANAYYKKGEYARAVDAYVGALKIDPDYAPAKKNLEYLLRAPERDPKQDGQGGADKPDPRDGKGGKDQGGRDRDRNRTDAGGKIRKGEMGKEQLMNILKSMQEKPVRRERGKGDGRRSLEKSW